MSQMSCRGSHNLKERPIDLQALTTIQQNNFTPQPPHSRDPLTLTVCVTTHPSITSRQHYFHPTAPLYMERRICFRRPLQSWNEDEQYQVAWLRGIDRSEEH